MSSKFVYNFLSYPADGQTNNNNNQISIAPYGRNFIGRSDQYLVKAWLNSLDLIEQCLINMPIILLKLRNKKSKCKTHPNCPSSWITKAKTYPTEQGQQQTAKLVGD